MTEIPPMKAEVTEHQMIERECPCCGESTKADARRSKLQKKRNALATRMRDRADDYLRFARDLRVPFDNNQAEQAPHEGLRMHALDVRRRGLLRHPFLPRHRRPLRHRRSRALTRAAQGDRWIPESA